MQGRRERGGEGTIGNTESGAGLMTVTETAEFFGVTPRTIRTWIRKGTIEAARPGQGRGRFVIREDAVKRIIEPCQAEQLDRK